MSVRQGNSPCIIIIIPILLLFFLLVVLVLLPLLLLLLLLLALQFLVDLSLFQNCPPLFSIPLLLSPFPHAHVPQIFPIWLNPPKVRFSYTSSAFCFKNSKLSTRIQFLHSKEVSQPPKSSYLDHSDYAPPISGVRGVLWIVPRKVKCKGNPEPSMKTIAGGGYTLTLFDIHSEYNLMENLTLRPL
jgi:hypothetical protein